MNNQSLPYKPDQYYDIVIYREVALGVLVGINEIMLEGTLSPCYYKSFQQAAGIYETLLVAIGYFDKNEACTAEDIELAKLVIGHLEVLSVKHQNQMSGLFESFEIEEIVKTLRDLAGGQTDTANYPFERLEDVDDLFVDFWWMLNEECTEVGISIPPCSIYTEISYEKQ